MPEADLMLVLNKALQKTGEKFDTRFSQIKYAPLRAVSILFTEKANTGLLIFGLLNVFI